MHSSRQNCALDKLRRIQHHQVVVNDTQPVAGLSTINQEHTAILAALTIKTDLNPVDFVVGTPTMAIHIAKSNDRATVETRRPRAWTCIRQSWAGKFDEHATTITRVNSRKYGIIWRQIAPLQKLANSTLCFDFIGDGTPSP